MKIPEFLKKGDKVAIVCPASYIKGDIDLAVTVLTEWGLEVEVGETVTSQFHQFAGTDALRAADLQKALDDPSIKAVFAARGGYGTVRIIDHINFNRFRKHPKWVIGFSDITVLHSHIHHRFNIPTIHGQMPKSFEDSSKDALESLKRALFGQKMDFTYSQTDYPNRSGNGSGQLIGGNLAILQSILSSKSDGKYDGKVLFIEDVGESHYNIDRMLWTLKRAKKLDKLAGLIVGGFTSLKDSDPAFGQRFEDIIMDKVRAYDFPVAFGYPAGHIENNHSLIMGKNIKLRVKNEETSLKYLD
ncbi:S66 peptidase family protein [Sphingobacterium psychroaquaticum]|uniref:Muramoyltetrapeptide carboxypeptidase n=1 Tax=Sphingobacterium psychroaquaticum TaxID=561061 RepID=A0A1X7K0R4_9SPHI|nr:LD-carboxypeptidase [Sphingobacterium psychroaquaticum]SMG34214.1 muramoyltetrapeptide carboxypeptidase [Sphingobacterium psychroaquaticum]